MIVAVDFDKTLHKGNHDSIGAPNRNLIDGLNEMRHHGAKLILWTCRGGEALKEAVDWCRSQGLEFDAVNEDVPEVKDTDFGKTKSGKVYADVYIDDKNYPQGPGVM